MKKYLLYAVVSCAIVLTTTPTYAQIDRVPPLSLEPSELAGQKICQYYCPDTLHLIQAKYLKHTTVLPAGTQLGGNQISMDLAINCAIYLASDTVTFLPSKKIWNGIRTTDGMLILFWEKGKWILWYDKKNPDQIDQEIQLFTYTN
ncbi:MAG: hypothetical protein ABIO57_03655 [Candidatus Paceibacterota bacterium]